MSARLQLALRGRGKTRLVVTLGQLLDRIGLAPQPPGLGSREESALALLMDVFPDVAQLAAKTGAALPAVADERVWRAHRSVIVRLGELGGGRRGQRKGAKEQKGATRERIGRLLLDNGLPSDS
jgi:hypothetical protein